VAEDLEAAVEAALEADRHVTSVRLVGSRARGSAGELSDWDFAVETGDFAALAPRMRTLVEPLAPLAAQWDPLGTERCYMLILRGPVKVDLIFDEPQEESPPWSVERRTLPLIDDHFWDWTLWLVPKDVAGKAALVADELEKMHRHLLGPLGVDAPPRSIEEAVAAYLPVRDATAARLGAKLSRSLEREVLPVLRRGA
jgi:predicted nucleotidyltransferase